VARNRPERGSLSRSTSEPQAALGQLDRTRPIVPAAGRRPALRSSWMLGVQRWGL